ncbi:MAG: sulfotransferase family 2 domain-containing protein [Chloroflexota bacterium]
MISEKYKCIFIHIPKTAGTSIEYKLQSFGDLKTGAQDHRSIREIEPDTASSVLHDLVMLDRDMLFNQLKNLVRHQRRASAKEFQEYFKFTFVRNPWARVYSWYQNVMRDENHRKRHGVPDDCTFESFLEDHANQWALQPQLYWLTDRKGNIPLDFIGRFESLAGDFAHVCEVLKLDDSDLPRMIASKSKHHYTDFYNEKTKKLVAKRYAEEIDYFGYHFDN